MGRVIARPFIGEPGALKRTDRRRDFSLPPVGPTVLTSCPRPDTLFTASARFRIFSQAGNYQGLPSPHNNEVQEAVLEAMDELQDEGLIFANFVDFDTLWGHRNDAEGYARGLEQLDLKLEPILKKLTPNDLLVITADHGCDPTTESTDHSREYVPLLVTSTRLNRCIPIGVRETFADAAASIAEFFGLSWRTRHQFLESLGVKLGVKEG